MSENKTVKGYKVFNPDWTCREFQYQVGECYETDEKPIVCERGYHFCEKLVDCYDYYNFDKNNKVAEITAYGDIDIDKNKKKYCTNKIKIEKKVNWNEVIDIVNTGKNCTGFGNNGDHNSGNHNSGDHNRGDHNSGDYNSGDHNSGNHNSGDWNSGYCNSGYWNRGDHNRGDYNSGDWNRGDYNSGDYNNGDYNISNYSNGCFNTKQTKMFLFNQLSDWTLSDWRNSEAKRILDAYVSVSPSPEETTKEEIFEQQQQNWNQLSQKQKEIVMAIPNFDKAIFKEVTGIDVEK